MDQQQPASGARAGFLQVVIGQHPTGTAVAIAMLVILALVLAYMLSECRNAPKEKYEPWPPGYLGEYFAPSNGACKAAWNPAATAQAQALATVGSFQHDSYGERALQGAINKAYDVGGLTEGQPAGRGAAP